MYKSDQKGGSEQLGWKMNHDVDRNRKCVLEGGKVKSCSRIKDGDGRLALGEN